MFESHPYDGNVSGEKNMNVKNIMRIEDACKNKATIRFAFISDTQYHYDETEAFVNAVNQRNDIDFVIHGGDITEYSMTGEFLRIRDLMNKLHVPYIALTGNHDCLATGRDIFRRVFGPEDFSFLAGNIKFVCLNTNSLEFDYAENVPDLDFMKKQADDSRPAYEKTVIVMHAAPFSNQFDGQRVYDFQQQLRNYKGLQFCLHGHNHGLTIDDFFEDGVIYYGVSSIEKHKYLLYTFNPDHEYGYEVTDF
jgi:predicted phosphodiesterase